MERTMFYENGYDYQYHYAVGGTHAKVAHTHTFYEFFLTLNENIVHIVNGKRQILHNDTFVFIRPGDEHYYEDNGDIIPAHINLAFRTEIVDEFFAYLGTRGQKLYRQLIESPMPPLCILSERNRQKVIAGLNSFNVLDKDERENLHLELRFFVAEMISLFAKQAPDGLNMDSPSWLNRLCSEMMERDNFILGIPRMVELSGKTREHLARTLKKYKNITISEFINVLRLEYAANLLVNSNMRVADICYESGFLSLDHFGKLFKKKYGVAPSEFRNIT